MVAPRLNLDVLTVVCTFLGDVSDILSFSLTCSSLHPVATRWLLLTSCIDLTEHVKIEKFHLFLFADVPARSPHVRELSIAVHSLQRPPGPMEPRYDHVPLIIDILTSCSHVETITLVLDNDSVGQSIADVVAGMQSLRSLSVRGSPFYRSSPRLPLALLDQVQSHLRMLDVNFAATAEGSSFWTPAALAQFLPRFAPTLEKLKVYRFIIDPECMQATHDFTMPPVFTMAQYPAVRSLSIENFRGKPLLDHLLHLFPALDDTLTVWYHDIMAPEDTYADIRATNQRAQEGDSLRDGSRSESRIWTKLDRVTCPVPILYVLGLRCPVRLVRLDRCSSYALHYAADALRENPVPRLALSLQLGGELSGLDALLSPELAGSLTHLTLKLEYTHENAQWRDPNAHATARFPFGHFLARMASAFRPLHKLTHLRIIILSHVIYPSYAAMMRSDEFMHTVHGRSFDFDGTSRSLVSALPALRYLFVETSGALATRDNCHFWIERELEHVFPRLARGWRIRATTEYPSQAPGAAPPHMAGGDAALVELSEEVSETLIRNEELLPWDDSEITGSITF